MDFQTPFINLIFSNWLVGWTVGFQMVLHLRPATWCTLFHQLQQFSAVFDNSGWPKRMGEYKNKVCTAQETGGKKQYLKFLFLIQPFQRLKHKKSSHGGIIQWLSGLRHTGSDPFVITHSTTLILTRQHLCHSFSAPSQRYCKFKAPRFILSIHYRSLFRWDLLQHHTRDTKRASVFTCVGWWK